MGSKKNSSSPFDFVLFGIIERISRFFNLVHDMKYENIDYYTGIINDIDECLWNILAEVISAVKQDIHPDNNTIRNILDSCKKIKKLHLKIGYLPIMDQQIELLRFQRLFKEGLKEKVPGVSKFSIGFVEFTTQEVYLATPLSEIKNELLNESFENKKLLPVFDFLAPSKQTNNDPRSHITLPRIELKNPLAWSIIAHEISHRLIDRCFDGITFFDDFKSFIEEEGVSFPLSLSEVKIEHHILEYWCDFLGTLIIGGSIGFAQCDAMFFDGIGSNDNDKHPPKYLRLWIIREILVNRLTRNNALADNESFINIFDNMQKLLLMGSQIDKEDKYLAMQFLNYLLKKYIFRDKLHVVKLAPALENLLDNFKRDNFEAGSAYIPELVDSLKNNFLIPSYRISKNDLEEKSTTIQDILLAGFIYRETELKGKILSIFRENVTKKTIVAEKSAAKINIESFLKEINSILGGFDTCLLRSIQISEYVNLLTGKKKQNEGEKKLSRRRKRTNLKKIGTVLNDEEIKKELIGHSINIIPLIDKIQIGSTSVDVRLGTSFQVYKPNQSGILDLISDKSINETEKTSTSIDLDFLDGIILVPGQFVLGHTMEYLVLPNNIAAELEGRSSYARLGIEIHMTAGFIDPGFNGVLTLELFNAGPNPIKIYPGLRIGQLRFFRCTPTIRPYNRNIYAKYKGLLRHNESLLVNDYEIDCFKSEVEKKRKNSDGENLNG
jgi:dCTP deaminase